MIENCGTAYFDENDEIRMGRDIINPQKNGVLEHMQSFTPAELSITNQNLGGFSFIGKYVYLIDTTDHIYSFVSCGKVIEVNNENEVVTILFDDLDDYRVPTTRTFQVPFDSEYLFVVPIAALNPNNTPLLKGGKSRKPSRKPSRNPSRKPSRKSRKPRRKPRKK